MMSLLSLVILQSKRSFVSFNVLSLPSSILLCSRGSISSIGSRANGTFRSAIKSRREIVTVRNETVQPGQSGPAGQSEQPQTSQQTQLGQQKFEQGPEQKQLGSASLPGRQLTLPRMTGNDVLLTNNHEARDIFGETTDTAIGIDYSGLYDPQIHLPSAPKEWLKADNTYEVETPLCRELIATIAVMGRPLTVAEYVHAALQHPRYGYYTAADQRSSHPFNLDARDTHDPKHPKQSVQDDFFNDEEYYDSLGTTPNTTSTPSMIGPKGDFITAPEITSLFGECITVWFFANLSQNIQQQQQEQQQHSKNYLFQWLELGPGNGSLIVDLIRSGYIITKRQNQLLNSPHGGRCKFVHLIETSPIMRNIQKETLLKSFHSDHSASTNNNNSNNNNSSGIRLVFPTQSDHNDDHTKTLEENNSNDECDKQLIYVYWHNTLDEFRQWQQQQKQQGTPLYTFVVGQEFLDALPIHVFEKTIHGYWRERMIDVAVCDDYVKSVHSNENEASDDYLDQLGSTSNNINNINNNINNINVNMTESAMLLKRHDTYNTAKQPSLVSTSPTIPSISTPLGVTNNSKSTIEAAFDTNSLTSTKLAQMKRPRLRIVLAPEATPELKKWLNTDNDGYIILPSLSSFSSDDVSLEEQLTYLQSLPAGSIVEVCPGAHEIVQKVAEMLHECSDHDYGSAALFVDYGPSSHSALYHVGDTIRAYSGHKQVFFLSHPGQVDVTADVDFYGLKRTVNNQNNRLTSDKTNKSNKTNKSVRAYGPIGQGDFLMSMGLKERVLSLINDDDDSQDDDDNHDNGHIYDEDDNHNEDHDEDYQMAESLYNAMVQLASPEHMGQRFRVLAITQTTSVSETNNNNDGKKIASSNATTSTFPTLPPPGFDT